MTTPSYFYSPATGGFYLEGMHEDIPEDAIALSEAEWTALVDGLAQGASIISTGAGTLSLQMPAPDPDSVPPPDGPPSDTPPPLPM